MEIKELQEKIVKFRDARGWKQFHNFKDTSLSLVLEAAEVLEHFQWKSNEEMKAYAKKHKHEIAEELSDVFYWVLLISHDLGIDLVREFKKKQKKNEEKYPVKTAKGNHKKYTEL
jgi:NTP pyrophosphatase (non-canonical NTP hydrolase)